MQEPRNNLPRLNAIRMLIVLVIAFGYASTMPIGPDSREMLSLFGIDPSWVGIQLLFFFSGYLALASIRRKSDPVAYLSSKIARNIPLLAVFTFVSVAVIYPIFGVHTGGFLETTQKLALYFIQTVSCVNPGQPLPGLLDEAKYACLIQGAIWTLKWGAIAHIGVAVSERLGFLRRDGFILGMAVLSVCVFAVFSFITFKGITTQFEILVLPSRLAFPFVVGMAVYAYRDALPKTFKARLVLPLTCLVVAFVNYMYMPWTPFIEISVSIGSAFIAYLLATSRSPKLKALDNWPNLVLGVYLVNWPTSQILLLCLPDVTGLGLIALSLPISVLIAIAAHKGVAYPINRRIVKIRTQSLNQGLPV